VTEQNRVIEGERFDKPLVLPGAIDAEPERYIAEKPYELTKYEFSILRKKMSSELFFVTTISATAGVLIAVIGKSIVALLDKKSPTLEPWEIWAVVIGFLAAIAFKFIRSKDDKERLQLEEVVDGHFRTNRPRRVHVTTSGAGK
jgi:hypothetical protein